MNTEGLPAPEFVDLVVLGSGAAALAAAATAAGCGARVLVLEKTGLLGGTSALSGGEIWVPCSDAAREAGLDDSLEACETYLRALIGPDLGAVKNKDLPGLLKRYVGLGKFAAGGWFVFK